MSDAERDAAIGFIAANPGAGIALGGGLRNVHIPREGSGKSGGFRTLCVFGGEHMPIALGKSPMSAYDSVPQGLKEALAFAEGKTAGARVHEVEIPAVDVARIRKQTGLSQAGFARSIGVPKGTLLDWEHGRRHPTGPAQVLLALIEREPSVVQGLLR